MSVIVDATKMPQDGRRHGTRPAGRGGRRGRGNRTITDNYTISKEEDYDILEQDYEDELTATQALNAGNRARSGGAGRRSSSKTIEATTDEEPRSRCGDDNKEMSTRDWEMPTRDGPTRCHGELPARTTAETTEGDPA